MKKYILKKQDQFDEWLNENWFAFIVVVGWFIYEWCINFDLWIGMK